MKVYIVDYDNSWGQPEGSVIVAESIEMATDMANEFLLEEDEKNVKVHKVQEVKLDTIRIVETYWNDG